MSSRTREELIDDLDDVSPADETVEFAMDGIAYEIDLSAGHAAIMRERMGMYIRAGRRAAARRPRSVANPALVRAWARERGINIGKRGRIPSEVSVRYLTETRPSRNGRSSV